MNARGHLLLARKAKPAPDKSDPGRFVWPILAATVLVAGLLFNL